jgi:hypothetical protein
MNELDLNEQYAVTNEESKWLQKLGNIDTYGDLDKLVKDINSLVTILTVLSICVVLCNRSSSDCEPSTGFKRSLSDYETPPAVKKHVKKLKISS